MSSFESLGGSCTDKQWCTRHGEKETIKNLSCKKSNQIRQKVDVSALKTLVCSWLCHSLAIPNDILWIVSMGFYYKWHEWCSIASFCYCKLDCSTMIQSRFGKSAWGLLSLDTGKWDCFYFLAMSQTSSQYSAFNWQMKPKHSSVPASVFTIKGKALSEGLDFHVGWTQHVMLTLYKIHCILLHLS